jgi:hypothetical protein
MTTTTIVSSGTGAPSLGTGRELHRNGTAIRQRRTTSGDHVRRRRVIDVDEGREPADGIGRREGRWPPEELVGSTCLLQPTPVAAARAALLLAPPPAVLGSAVPGSCVGRTAGNAGTVGVAGGGGGSTCSKTVLVTPYGSFLSVNQSPAEFRESTLSIGGGSSIGFNNCTGQIAAAAREMTSRLLIR